MKFEAPENLLGQMNLECSPLGRVEKNRLVILREPRLWRGKLRDRRISLRDVKILRFAQNDTPSVSSFSTVPLSEAGVNLLSFEKFQVKLKSAGS